MLLPNKVAAVRKKEKFCYVSAEGTEEGLISALRVIVRSIKLINGFVYLLS